MKNDYKVLILVLILNVIVGAASGGVAGYFASRANMPQDSGKLIPQVSTSTKPINQAQATSTIKLLPLSALESSPKVVPESMLSRKSPVGILYDHKKGSDPGLQANEEIGRVVALTSDGWFVAPLVLMQNKRSADLVIWYDRAAYSVTKALSDQVTQTVFLKTEAKSLSVAPFADLTGSRTGTAVWIESDVLDFVPTALISLRASDNPVSKTSDKTDRRLVISGWSNNQEKGSPVWDYSGSLIGLIESSGQGKISVIPSLGIAASLQGLLSDGVIKHATLGISSIDRSLVRLTPPGDGLPDRGAWINEEKKNQVVIAKASPAEVAGIKSGDVILQVDRDILDGSIELGDIIAEFRPGATVEIRVWRKGKEINLPVTLGSQVSSMPLN